ncbi:MAG TPA: hypothetical protein VE621_22795 [Bryobacteraceae bacterium]|nr:hypothetical protein [Bryobacteraceae bacterium]
MGRRLPARIHLRLSALALCGLVTDATAQDNVKELFGVAQERNAGAVRNLEWNSRTEVLIDGKSVGVRIDKVQFDPTGRIQRTMVRTQTPPDAQKKVNEVKSLLQQLSKLAQTYGNLNDAQREAAMRTVRVKSGDGELPGTVQLSVQNVVEPGDIMAIWADASTLLLQRAQVYTTFEKSSIQISAHYEQLTAGPVVPVRMQISYPAKKIQVDITNEGFKPGQAQATAVAAAAAGSKLPSEANPPEVDPGWPREFTNARGKLLTFQPQVNEWKDFKEMTWRMAVALTPAGGKEVVGAATMRGQTDVDHDKHIVNIHDLALVRANFPSLDATESANMQQLLATFAPPSLAVSLERIAACTPKRDTFRAVAVKNDPPPIFVAYKPTILVDVEGDPVYVPIRNTTLEYVLNTAWPLFRTTADGRFYVLAGDQWMAAPDIKGPWGKAAALPPDMTVMVQDEHFSQLRDFVPLKPVKSGAVAPDVLFSAKPAEVILFEGQPAYAEIPGTQLSYATNTENIVFRHAKTNLVYFLTAGRWFSAPALDGPWTFASPSLPEDFAKIPRESPAYHVVASVPGTEEANDAVLMAQIPTRATVDPVAAAAKAKVSYDGEPKFEAIEGTGVSYAVNTAGKVLKVGDTYYLCQDAVWFTSRSPNGPWDVARSVPDEIYSIPPSAPVYNVTYVNQATAADGTIEASYTAGYTGAMIMGTTVGFSVVYSTGWYYPPYIGYYPGWYYPYYPYYYARPYAYGAAGYYNSATGAYGFAQTVWGPYGSATRAARYNPYTGTYARAGSIATPYGRVSAGSAYNPYTGAAGFTRQGTDGYSQWGSSVVSKGGQSALTRHYSDARGTVGTIQGSGGGGAIGVNRNGGPGGFVGKTGGGDMYAGGDGNVYRNTGNGWQKYENGNWNNVNRPSGQAGTTARNSASAPEAVQGDFQSRQRGSYSADRYQQRSSTMNRPSPSPSFSRGGGFRGGGRRR